MPTEELGIGVLGAAAIAPAAIVEPARLVPGVEIRCIGARDLPRARAFAHKHRIPRPVQGYAAVLEDPDVDAVYIPLPNGLHGTWTQRALEAGKHVLCEKPFAANATEARRVVAAAPDDLVVMEAFHWRYHPLAQRVVDIVASGEIGTVTHIDAGFSFPQIRPKDIRWRADLAGGSLLDAGCYALHQIRTVGAAIGATGLTVLDADASLTRGGVDRQFTAQLRFDGGPTATLACGFLRPRRLIDIHLDVVGEQGSLHAFNPVLAHLGGHLRVKVAGRRRQEWFGATTSYTAQLRAFVDAVRDGAPYPTDRHDAVANMVVIDEMFTAAGVSPAHPTEEPDQ